MVLRWFSVYLLVATNLHSVEYYWWIVGHAVGGIKRRALAALGRRRRLVVARSGWLTVMDELVLQAIENNV